MYVDDILTEQEQQRHPHHLSMSKRNMTNSTSARRRHATKFPTTRVAAPGVSSADGIPLKAPESKPAPLELIKQEEVFVGDVRHVTFRKSIFFASFCLFCFLSHLFLSSDLIELNACTNIIQMHR